MKLQKILNTLPCFVVNCYGFIHLFIPSLQAEPIRVLVTGAAGQIAYSLLFSIAKGDVFGKDQVKKIFTKQHDNAVLKNSLLASS